MDHIAAVEQQLVSERKWRKLNEVNMAAQAQLGPVQDDINFTLQERLNRSLMVYQGKFESAKFQQNKTDAISELESCVDQSIKDNIKTLPLLVGRLRASFNIGG